MESDLPNSSCLRRWPVSLSGRSWELISPGNQEELLDDPQVMARFEEDEYLPYWGQLWPAAVMLADHILLHERGDDRPALEIGCGLGLVSMAARAAGWDTLATDYDEDALRFTRHNAEANGVEGLRVRFLDWRRPDLPGRFARIFASDVLYERRNHQPVADFIARHLNSDGYALVCDPNRKIARDFDTALRDAALAFETIPTHANQPYGRYVEGTIYRIRRA